VFKIKIEMQVKRSSPEKFKTRKIQRERQKDPAFEKIHENV